LFSGSLVALVTPFKNGAVDEEGLRKNVRFQIDNGTSGLVPCGTTGEAPTLSMEEWEEVISITVEEASDRIPVIAGTGTNSTAKTIELTRRAKELGAGAALVVTPYYNKPTQEGIYRHYKAVATETGFPLVLYNVPGRTGINMLPDTVTRLCELDEVVALKEASGNLAQASDIVRDCGSRLDLLSGDDILTLPMLSVGAKGVISVIANIVPGDVSRMVSCFLSGDVDEARKIHEWLIPLCRAIFIESNPIPIKGAMVMMGMPSGEPRLPLVPISGPNGELVRQELARYGLVGGRGDVSDSPSFETLS
jgi:4-hydroxy-tetrahydrodipicolinate synthase